MLNGDEAVRRYSYLAKNIARATWWTEYEDSYGYALEALWHAGEDWNGKGSFVGYAKKMMRWRIIDGYRTTHGRQDSSKTRRGVGIITVTGDLPVIAHHDVVEDDPLETMLESILAICANDAERTLIQMRARGCLDVEIGEALGVTSSRVCQMKKALHRRWIDKRSTVTNF